MFLKRDHFPVQVPAKDATIVDSEPSQDVQTSSKPLEKPNPEESLRISISELRELQQSGAPILIFDVRSDRNFETSQFQAQGALRISPAQAVQRAGELQIPRQTWLIAFCA